MLRQHGQLDPLIGHAFALYDTAGEALDIVYHVAGKMTGAMASLSVGDQLEVWGPLGNGLQISPTRHLIMVAGGIGQTPFLAMAKQYRGIRQ